MTEIYTVIKYTLAIVFVVIITWILYNLLLSKDLLSDVNSDLPGVEKPPIEIVGTEAPADVKLLYNYLNTALMHASTNTPPKFQKLRKEKVDGEIIQIYRSTKKGRWKNFEGFKIILTQDKGSVKIAMVNKNDYTVKSNTYKVKLEVVGRGGSYEPTKVEVQTVSYIILDENEPTLELISDSFDSGTDDYEAALTVFKKDTLILARDCAFSSFLVHTCEGTI